MYSSFEKRDRVMIRLALSTAWGFVTLSGLGGLFINPGSFADEIGPELPFFGSLIVSAFGIMGFVGVAFNKYWLEWVAAWFVSGGIFAYTVAFWYLVVAGNAGRFQNAALLTGLLMFFVYRIVSCAAHARKQRQIHKFKSDTGGTEIIDA